MVGAVKLAFLTLLPLIILQCIRKQLKAPQLVPQNGGQLGGY
jgi:hypothetical protein